MRDEKDQKINEGAKDCDDKIKSYKEGNLPPEPGCDAAQSLEAVITGILNKIREETGKVK